MVINTGDLRYLLNLEDYSKLPDFNIDLLNDAWVNIYTSFSEIAGGNRSDLQLVKMKRMTMLKMDHDLKSVIVDAVSAYPSQEMVELLSEVGFKVESDVDEAIQSAKRNLKRLKQKIQVLEHEMDSGDQQKSANMDALIATLERYQGYQFNEKTMTVSKFANIYKHFKDGRKQDNI